DDDEHELHRLHRRAEPGEDKQGLGQAPSVGRVRRQVLEDGQRELEDGVVSGGDDPFVDGYACRQRFLRSYKFSQKEETVAQRTKKWLRGAKQSTAAQSTSKEEGKNENKDKKKKSDGDGSCSFLEAVFTFCSCALPKWTSTMWFFGLGRTRL
ncbi:uncharacterized protein J3R85_017464, partial [Psidium guajava]